MIGPHAVRQNPQKTHLCETCGGGGRVLRVDPISGEVIMRTKVCPDCRGDGSRRLLDRSLVR